MRIFGKKIISAGLLIGLLTWLFLLPEGFVDDAVGCFPPPCYTCPPCWTGCYCDQYNIDIGCPTCDSSQCFCCRDCQCYFRCPDDKACIVEITGHDLCYEGCHNDTIWTGSMNGTYILQHYGNGCDWEAVYPSDLNWKLFWSLNNPNCPNPPNTEPCTCLYMDTSPVVMIFDFHFSGSDAFLYIYGQNIYGEDTGTLFYGGTESVNCLECTISAYAPVFCPNGVWASPTAKITVNSDPTCASCCDTALCETCVGGECKVCGGDPNKTCCYGNCCNKKSCEECNDITHSCEVCGGRPGEDCCPNNVGCFKPPSGCDRCGTSTSVTPTPNEQNGCSYCGGNAGVFTPGSASYTLKMPCYKSCKWEVQLDTVTATVYICRSCPANSPTVACLSDVAGMTQAQACAHKLNFPHDPFQYADRSTANWCGDCISDHETRHETFWLATCLQPQIADFQSWLADHPIDVTSASNCTTAIDSNWQAQCTAEWNTLMTIAVTTWNNADKEPPAEAAESACYQSILDALKAKCP